MKTNLTRSLMAYCGLLVTAGTANAAVTIVKAEGHNTLSAFNAAATYGSSAPAHTQFALGDGQIHSGFVLQLSEDVILTDLVLSIDRNFDGDYIDPGDVVVNFTSTSVSTPGTSPVYTLFEGPGLSNQLPDGTDLTGGGPFRTFVISDHQIGDGGDTFEANWSGTATSTESQSSVVFNISVSNTPVPEPGVALLGSLGLFALVRRRRC